MNINSYQEADDMPAAEVDRRHNETREILQKAGAHYVIDSFADIELVIEDVNQRLARGERP
jgi:phosphonoacetaldehyde hydrolase